MPVILMFRHQKQKNFFNEYLNRIIKAPDGDSLLLCSGYFEEGNWKYKILDSELLDSIRKGCRSGKVITIGPVEGPEADGGWAISYKEFVNRLICEGLNVEAYTPKPGSGKWHAKVAIRLRGGLPIAALVGSSNLTRRAYDVINDGFLLPETATWNHESDAVIFLSTKQLKDHFYSGIPVGNIGDPIFCSLDPEKRQPKEDQQMDYLFRTIMGNVTPIRS